MTKLDKFWSIFFFFEWIFSLSRFNKFEQIDLPASKQVGTITKAEFCTENVAGTAIFCNKLNVKASICHKVLLQIEFSKF